MLVGCSSGRRSVAQTETEPTVLNVSAAMTLKGVFERIAPEFEAANDVRIVFNFGASGVLQKQIEGGADVDVFASAAPKHIDALIADGIASTDATVSFASNQAVILVPKGNPLGVREPKDLERVERIAIGNVNATPVGATAKMWLQGRNLWAVLEPRIVFGENAGQVSGYVDRGEVDAAVVFASEATGRENVEVAYRVPIGEAPDIRYVMTPIGTSRRPLLARAFIEFVMSEDSQQALVDGGFLRRPQTPSAKP